MLNPERLIEDLFDDSKLADYNLRAFCDDHLLRLSISANNPGGIYSPLITNTSTKYNAFFGKMTNEATKIAISQGLTSTMEATKKDAIDGTVHFENLVAFKFGKPGGIYQEFYPYGLTEYHNANLDQLPTIFVRLKNAANTHLLASNPTDVADLITLLDGFTAARAAQETAFGEVETLQTGRREDRAALTLQLTTNLLTIALNNLLNPDNFNNYYNPSYLPLTEGSTTVSGIILASATVMAVNQGVITGSSHLSFHNLGTEDLIFSINDQPAVIHASFTTTVAAGNHFNHNEQLPVFDKYYINVQNPSGVSNGKWKVVIS